MRRSIGGWGRVGVLIVVAAGLVAAGIAYAAIPDAQGVLHACYDKKKGTLRLIDPGSGGACNAKKENPVDWNRGPTDLPAVGAFTPTQLVQGAVLTCTSTDNSGDPRCNGARLNGLYLEYGGDVLGRICATVTGGGFSGGGSLSGSGGAPHFIWTGSAWAMSSDAYYPLDYVVCETV